MLPILFGILTSFCFAIASLLAQRGYHVGPAPWGAWITIATNCGFLFAAHFLLRFDTQIFIWDNLIFVAVGLFVPGVTRVLSFRAIQSMGSSVTSTIVNTTPMFSTVFAIALLAERPTTMIVAGVMATVAGLVTVSWGGVQAPYRKIELVYALLCPLIFSLKDVTVRWALAGGEGQPILSAGIAALTSTIQIFLFIRFVQDVQFALPPAPVARWFISSGIFTGGSFLFMYVALSLERVSIIAPLINSYAVFVILLTPLMAKQIEKVTLRRVVGVAMVVAGIFLVALGKD